MSHFSARSGVAAGPLSVPVRDHGRLHGMARIDAEMSAVWLSTSRWTYRISGGSLRTFVVPTRKQRRNSEKSFGESARRSCTTLGTTLAQTYRQGWRAEAQWHWTCRSIMTGHPSSCGRAAPVETVEGNRVRSPACSRSDRNETGATSSTRHGLVPALRQTSGRGCRPAAASPSNRPCNLHSTPTGSGRLENYSRRSRRR